jgi:hypothetical protein
MEVSFTLNRKSGGKGRRIATPRTTPGPLRIRRLSRLMALAIRFDTLIQEGAVTDQAALARLGGVTRARLAPDIQEELLFLPAESRMVERTIRPVVRLVEWSDQRRAFREAKAGGDKSLEIIKCRVIRQPG